MGAYLSEPVTEKESTDAKGIWLSYGTASMQGWRYFQEDAHNCILDYDPDNNASFFAVYDGHGGAEVAIYTSEKFPNFLKRNMSYVEGNIEKALEESFIEFDATLVEADAQAALKVLAKDNTESDSEDNSDDDPNALTEEANQPLESVLERYGGADALPNQLKTFLRKEKFQSPNVSNRKRRRPDMSNDDGPSSSSSAVGTSNNTHEHSEGARSSPDGKSETESATNDQSENNKVDDGLSSDNQEIPENGSGDHDSSTAATKEKQVPDSSSNSKENVDDDDDDDVDYAAGDEAEEEDSEDSEEEDSEEDDDDDDGEDVPQGNMFGPGGLIDDNGEPGYDSGTTAVIALLTHGGMLYVANAGDSRCVLCRDGKAVDMSVDHKPTEEPETARITSAGGSVTQDGRVNGGLNLSRAIGDHAYKRTEGIELRDQMITALPGVMKQQLDAEKDKFMVLACDGIWNSMSSQEVVDFVSEKIEKGLKLSAIAELMFDHCLAPDTSGDGTGCDNMTCIIVRFDDLAGYISAPKGAAKSQLANGNSTKNGNDSEETPAKRKKILPEDV